MERRGRELISGTQTEVYPPLPASWGKEKESLQTGHAPRVFCQPPAFAHTTYLGSILRQYWDLSRLVAKHRRDNKVHPQTPTNTSAGPNLRKIPQLVTKKTNRTPRQHFQEHLAMHLEILTLCPSCPPAPDQWLSPHHPPRGWEPVSPPALGKSPAKFAHHTPQPRCTPLTLPWREGRQPTSPCSAVRLRAGRRVMESGELFSDNQRWEAAPVNSVHPVAAGSVSSSWQQPSQEQWWAQLEIFHN